MSIRYAVHTDAHGVGVKNIPATRLHAVLRCGEEHFGPPNELPTDGFIKNLWPLNKKHGKVIDNELLLWNSEALNNLSPEQYKEFERKQIAYTIHVSNDDVAREWARHALLDARQQFEKNDPAVKAKASKDERQLKVKLDIWKRRFGQVGDPEIAAMRDQLKRTQVKHRVLTASGVPV